MGGPDPLSRTLDPRMQAGSVDRTCMCALPFLKGAMEVEANS